MNFKTIFLSVFAGVILFFIGREDWMMLLPIPMAQINAYINYKAIQKFRVGKLYHNLQFWILVLMLGALKWFNLLMWDELLLVTSIYYFTFEIGLNLMNGWEWDYTGTTSSVDKAIRNFLFTMVNFKVWWGNGWTRFRNLFRKKANEMGPLIYFNTYSLGQLRTLNIVIKLFLFFGGVAWYLADKPL